MKQFFTELESKVSLSPNKDVLVEQGALAYFNLWVGILYLPALVGITIKWLSSSDEYQLLLIGSVFISILGLLIIEGIVKFSDGRSLFLNTYITSKAVDNTLQDKLMPFCQTKGIDFKLAYDFYKEKHEEKFNQTKYNLSKLLSWELLIGIVGLYMAYQGINLSQTQSSEELKFNIIEGSVGIVLYFVLLRISLFLISDIYKFYSGYIRGEALLRFMFNNIKMGEV
ncbi:hypothetical protein [Thiomicrorhabdus sediminis]|uniref:Uncharacterized protein n=1 Tax=Thiomicrorhabdus sediminis TaxID=2580412 RepID=A0A4P9K626_9GAMM|nr:hypothetical protein [Thiomicrorhabdus sediminis]QCU90475.1 hypothetical protein FE785_07435 [Thiomicrorhabdus sediminis]